MLCSERCGTIHAELRARNSRMLVVILSVLVPGIERWWRLTLLAEVDVLNRPIAYVE